MSFMTILAASLLAGFAVGGFVWLSWSIAERMLARKPSTPAAESAEASDEKSHAKSGAK